VIVFWVPTRLHCVVKEGWVKEDVLVMLSNANEKVVGCGWYRPCLTRCVFCF